MDIMCTEVLWSGFGDELAEAAPGAGWLVMGADGKIEAVAPGSPPVPRDAAETAPEIVIGSYDLWDGGGAYEPFFTYLSRAPGSLRWFQSCAAGFEAEIYRSLMGRGVRLTTGHAMSSGIAEYVLWAVLDTFLRADEWRTRQAERRWRRAPVGHREVRGSSWLVVGMGSIGGEVATRARALGAQVTGVRRRPTGDEPADRMITPSEVHAALPGVDVVVLCAPASASTQHLADDAFFAAMAPGSVLVNVGRGELVDEEALMAALDAGRPGHAVLDVAGVEPLPADSPLWRHPRVVLTPHASGHTASTNARYLPLVLDNLSRYQSGQPLLQERVLADWRR